MMQKDVWKIFSHANLSVHLLGLPGAATPSLLCSCCHGLLRPSTALWRSIGLSVGIRSSSILDASAIGAICRRIIHLLRSRLSGRTLGLGSLQLSKLGLGSLVLCLNGRQLRLGLRSGCLLSESNGPQLLLQGHCGLFSRKAGKALLIKRSPGALRGRLGFEHLLLHPTDYPLQLCDCGNGIFANGSFLSNGLLRCCCGILGLCQALAVGRISLLQVGSQRLVLAFQIRNDLLQVTCLTAQRQHGVLFGFNALRSGAVLRLELLNGLRKLLLCTEPWGGPTVSGHSESTQHLL